MAGKERRMEQVLGILKSENVVSVGKLADDLGVSEMTVRRYLASLESEGVVTVLHGGAFLNRESYFEAYEKKYLLSREEIKQREEKERIGRAASELVGIEDIVIIDAGTTTEWLAKFLPDRPVKVLCYALNILIELQRKEHCHITFAGGDLHKNTLIFECPEGIDLINRFRARKAFLSASGVHSELGVTAANSYETEVKKAVMKSGLKKVLLVDSTKFGAVSSGHYADIKDFDTIITDAKIPTEYARVIEKLGIECIIAEK